MPSVDEGGMRASPARVRPTDYAHLGIDRERAGNANLAAAAGRPGSITRGDVAAAIGELAAFAYDVQNWFWRGGWRVRAKKVCGYKIG